MSEERRRTSRWGRWRKRIFLFAVAAPFLFVAVADLLLCSPWPRRWVAGKVSRKLGMEVSIGPIFWTPWTGLVVKEVQVDPPDELRDSMDGPVLRTGPIQVETDWGSVFRGKPAFRRICINDPDLTLTPGLVSAIAAARKRPEPQGGPDEVAAQPAESESPALAAVPPAVVDPASDPAPSAIPSGGANPSPSIVQAAPAGPVAVPQQNPPAIPATGGAAAKAPPQAAAVAEVPQPPPDIRPATTLEVRGAHFRMLSPKGGAPLAEVSGFSMRMPVQGADADGHVSLKSLKVLDKPLIEGLDFPLIWRSPEVQIVQQHLQVAGIDVELSLRLARKLGLPFVAEIRSPAQAMPVWDAPLDRKLSSRRLEGAVRIGGSLPAPATWQGGGGMRLENLRVESDERTVIFTRGDAVFLVQPGFNIRCPDARLIGEEFSLLGNGFIHPEDGKAAVLRWVATPEVLTNWRQKVKQFDPALEPRIASMGTPERAMIDFSLVSSGEQPGIELGAGGPVIPIAAFVSLLGH